MGQPGVTVWTLVIPIRNPKTGKSRLGLGRAVAEAIARDTHAAAELAETVGRIVVVTDTPTWTAGMGDEVLVQQRPGLADAVRAGLLRAGQRNVAVMLGDIPVLQPSDLDAALAMAARVPRGMVADRAGTGTTLITAKTATEHRPRFGQWSAARHRAAGYADLPVPPDSSLRLDVDTQQDLADAADRGFGPAVARELAGVAIRRP